MRRPRSGSLPTWNAKGSSLQSFAVLAEIEAFELVLLCLQGDRRVLAGDIHDALICSDYAFVGIVAI